MTMGRSIQSSSDNINLPTEVSFEDREEVVIEPVKKKPGRKKKAQVIPLSIVPKVEHRCNWCKKQFVKEESIMSHMCEKKRRWLWKDEKYMKIAYLAYERIYATHYRHKTSYEKFMESKMYSSFVKFGRYALTTDMLDVYAFIDFLVKAEIKTHDWVNPHVYMTWVRDMVKNESIDAAVERTILLMEQWGNDTGYSWVEFFRLIPTTKAVSWISSGRISPWVIYGTTSGMELFKRMSIDQLKMIKDIVDSELWADKIDKEINYERIMSILWEAGV